MTAALSHIRVCDLSGQLAGAGATKILAAFGAEVIRVEDPVNRGLWDALRGVGPYVDERRGVNLGVGFNNHNVGKRGVTINLRTDEGKQLLRELIAVSDVVCENFAAGRDGATAVSATTNCARSSPTSSTSPTAASGIAAPTGTSRPGVRSCRPSAG